MCLDKRRVLSPASQAALTFAECRKIPEDFGSKSLPLPRQRSGVEIRPVLLNRKIALLTALLGAFSAMAQPIQVIEHDWTFSIAGERCGIEQTTIAPGKATHWTTVYCGGPVFSIPIRAEMLLGLVILLCAATCGALLRTRASRDPESAA